MKTKAISLIFVLFAIAVGMASMAPTAFADHNAEIAIVIVDESGFSQACVDEGCYVPLTATVEVGGVVTMTNTDPTAVHTFTSGTVDGSAPSPDGVFDTGVLMYGDAFEWIPTEAGEQPYYCMLHAWMIGTIIVQEAAAEEHADDHGDDHAAEEAAQAAAKAAAAAEHADFEVEDFDEDPRFQNFNCNPEIDKDGDDFPDNLDVEGPIDWSNCNLFGLDLSNRELSDATLVRSNLYLADLHNTNLSGADLSYSQIYKADISDTNFTYANLSYANFCGANNPLFDFTGADLSYAAFDNAFLINATLTGAIIKHTNFYNSTLANVDLSGMDLTGTILVDADLTNANLENVDLSGKDLTGTILADTDLSGKDLTGTILVGADLTNANLENVDLSGMDLTGTILDCLSTPIRCQDIFIDTNLQNTNLTDASFVSADLTKIKNKSLAGADLSGASFAHSNLSDVNMSNVILDATNFWKADLTGQGLTVIYDVNTLLYHFNNLIQKIF